MSTAKSQVGCDVTSCGGKYCKLTVRRCDLTRPCQTCRDRDHPELCSYHPPNKRQSVEQSQAIPRTDDTPSGGGFVTLARGEFDFLCRKLNSLENSIADMRHEMRRTGASRSIFADTDATHETNIDPAMEAAPAADEIRHADAHGVHMKNVAVSAALKLLRLSKLSPNIVPGRVCTFR